ncbi:MAG: MoaD/ThiS family protein [Elusimicrobiales bacterium]|jgi:molybdopterin converting factor small subunit
MAKITVMVYTTLRDRLGFSRAGLEGRTVRELLLKLAASAETDISGILFDKTGAVRNHFVLTLNSEIIDNGKTDKAAVKAGDILHVFPPISGG